jgi:hypothetical protein
MSTDDRKFDKHRILPLAQEAESAASLLAHGIDLVRRIGAIEPSPMFACLAMGTEKLLKLSIGLLSWETTGAWPSQSEMRNRLRHGIGTMHARTLNELGHRLSDPRTAGSAHIAISALRQEVVDDPILTFALMALSDYAQQGRFYNLDILAGAEPLAASPSDRWNQLEKDILALNPTIAARIGTDSWNAEGQPLINNQIADSLLRWWRLHQRSWNTGALGRQAQLWSTRLGSP